MDKGKGGKSKRLLNIVLSKRKQGFKIGVAKNKNEIRKT